MRMLSHILTLLLAVHTGVHNIGCLALVAYVLWSSGSTACGNGYQSGSWGDYNSIEGQRYYEASNDGNSWNGGRSYSPKSLGFSDYGSGLGYGDTGYGYDHNSGSKGYGYGSHGKKDHGDGKIDYSYDKRDYGYDKRGYGNGKKVYRYGNKDYGYGKKDFIYDKAGSDYGKIDYSYGRGSSLKCYSDQLERIVKCDENLGYRTCFTRYSERGEITGRGCSTKDKVYYKECETNSYGAGTEKFCYCNFYLCNAGAQTMKHQTVGIVILALAAFYYNNRFTGI